MFRRRNVCVHWNDCCTLYIRTIEFNDIREISCSFTKSMSRHFWINCSCQVFFISVELIILYSIHACEYRLCCAISTWNKRHIHLPRLTELKVDYDHLTTVTTNFTRDATRRNCAKVKWLIVEKLTNFPKDVYQYFPLL